MRKLILPLLLMVIAAVWFRAIVTAEYPATAAPIAPPATTPYTPASWRTEDGSGLPACESEDGTGQSLCYWDAASEGNGEGTSLISGDCAPSIVGGWDVASKCVILYGRPDGQDAAMECMGVYNENEDSALKEMGWSFTECYKAMGIIDDLYN